MLFRKLVVLTSLFTLMCAFAVAQTDPTEAAAEKAKKKKEADERVVAMLDQAASDVGGLKLAGNRAIIDAMTADLYWKYDEKRARELFKNAANEINTFYADSEKERADSTEPDYNISDPADPRTDVLNLIAKHDVDLALEVLLQTRSQRLADAMAKAAAAGTGTTVVVDPMNITATMDNARAMQEIQLEASYAQRAAANDPDKLIKLIKDSIAKGVNTGILSPLQSLNQKDAKKAADLGSDVIVKLGESDFAKNQTDMRTALSFLQFAARPAPPPSTQPAAPGAPPAVKPFAFSDMQMKGLAGKVVDALLVPTKSIAGMTMISSYIPTLEKFVPERIAALRARDAENKKNLPTEMKSSMSTIGAFDPNATPEDLLTQLGKSSNETEKRMIYPMLTQKISQITDEARAKKLIDQIPDEKNRAAAQEQFDANKISRAIAAGKVDDARRLIGTLTNRKMQIQRLVALAMQVQRKNTEKDTETAKSLMTDAKGLTKEFPDDEDDLADIMEIVRGYATIEPETAFRMFEPIIGEFNDMVQSSAVLSKYNKRDRTFKKGELVMRINGGFGGNILMFRYLQQIQMLGKADLERMSVLADRFGRSDTRTFVKLVVLQGYLAPDPKPLVQGGTSGVGAGVGTAPPRP